MKSAQKDVILNNIHLLPNSSQDQDWGDEDREQTEE